MKPEGLIAFSYKTESRSKIYSHEKEPVALDLSYENQFKQDQVAWDFFSEQAASYKKVMIHWIMSAKQEKTRQSRLDKTIEISRQLKRME